MFCESSRAQPTIGSYYSWCRLNPQHRIVIAPNRTCFNWQRSSHKWHIERSHQFGLSDSSSGRCALIWNERRIKHWIQWNARLCRASCFALCIVDLGKRRCFLRLIFFISLASLNRVNNENSNYWQKKRTTDRVVCCFFIEVEDQHVRLSPRISSRSAQLPFDNQKWTRPKRIAR